MTMTLKTIFGLFPIFLAQGALAIAPGDIPFIERTAQRGNDASQVLLATAYLNGDGGLPKVPGLAAHWFEQAALQGNSFAEERIGDLYEQGLGVTANPVLAFDWRIRAARQGNPQAQVKVARMYLAGLGVKQDRAEAMNWLQRAAAEGNAEAQFLLGKLGHEEATTPKARSEAMSWLELAARQGYQDAVELFHLLVSVGHDLENDFHRHRPNLVRMASDGDVEAQFMLAQRYEHGTSGEKKDMAAAVRWYERAAEGGHRTAMTALSRIYGEGDGVPRDTDAARKWAERASAASTR